MKRNIFKLFIITIALGIGFTSCTDDDEWVKAQFDYSMEPPIDWNGSFQVTNTIYLNDVNSISGIRGDIHDIDARNSWIQIETDEKNGFSRGDEIRINRIVVNGQALDFSNYYVSVGTSLEGSGVITFDGDQVYANFMHNAMKILNDRGRIEVTVYGSSSMYRGNLYIVLANNLDLLID